MLIRKIIFVVALFFVGLVSVSSCSSENSDELNNALLTIKQFDQCGNGELRIFPDVLQLRTKNMNCPDCGTHLVLLNDQAYMKAIELTGLSRDQILEKARQMQTIRD